MSLQCGLADFRAPSSHVRALSPYETRLGGLPSYFSTSRPPHPVCQACHSPLFLVLQLYAPADCERTLYVFGCNSAGCSAVASGGMGGGAWCVYRSQGAPVQAAAAAQPAAAVAAAAAAAGPVGDAWGAAGAWDEEEGPAGAAVAAAAPSASGGLGGWGQASAAAAAAGQAAAAASAAAAAQAAAAAAAVPLCEGEHCRLPAFPISTVFVDAEEEGAGGEDSEEEEEGSGGCREVGGGSRGAAATTSKGADWDYAMRLYEQYQQGAGSSSSSAASSGGGAGSSASAVEDSAAREELEGGAAALESGLFSEFQEEGEGEGAVEEGEEEAAAQLPQQASSTASRKGVSFAPSAAAAPKPRPSKKPSSSSSSSSDGYEKTPAALRYMLNFQAALAAEPSCVLRYTWDSPSAVLWPILPLVGARAIEPPPCKACGSARQLECQLLPTMLYGLKVEEWCIGGSGGSGSGSGGGSGGVLQRLQGGMDFLTVLVFSCQASCSEGGEEWAFVVPN